MISPAQPHAERDPQICHLFRVLRVSTPMYKYWEVITPLAMVKHHRGRFIGIERKTMMAPPFTHPFQRPLHQQQSHGGLVVPINNKNNFICIYPIVLTPFQGKFYSWEFIARLQTSDDRISPAESPWSELLYYVHPAGPPTPDDRSALCCTNRQS